jgi:hypothetical protein
MPTYPNACFGRSSGRHPTTKERSRHLSRSLRLTVPEGRSLRTGFTTRRAETWLSAWWSSTSRQQAAANRAPMERLWNAAVANNGDWWPLNSAEASN